MNVKFMISVLVLIGGILLAREKAKKGKSFMPTILIGISISVAIVIYPGFNGESNFLKNGINTLVYIIQSWLFSEDISLVQSEKIGNEFIQIWLCIELLCLPVLTAGSILEILQKYFGKIKLSFARKRDLHIFSNINEKSTKIAELIRKDFPKDKIVFCKAESSEKTFLSNRKSILIKDNIVSLDIKANKRAVKFYVMSEDEEETLKETISLVEKYKNQKCEILSFTSDEENKMILDEIDKGKAVVNIIDEIQNSIYHLLVNHPLYENAQDNKIKVLLVGLGNVGKEVFKSIIWCGQMPQYTLEMNIVEKDEEKLKEVAFECPEIFKYSKEYNLNCYTNDIREIENNIQLQEKIKNTNYIVIATGDEEDSIRIAKNLRRFFLKEEYSVPEIFIWMQESIKKEKIKEIKNPYTFKPFGDIREIYSAIQKNSKIERMAIKLHLSYNPKDTELIEYNRIEYNKKSSRATALHVNYKLYPYIKRDESGKILSGEIDRIINDKNILLEISESEHKRWLAYLRTEGYEFAGQEVAKKYFAKTGRIREHFIKMHPALTDWNSLEEAQKTISIIENKPEKDMKQSTIQSVIDMIQNVKKEIK